jgi:hypothetical protein
MKKTSCKQPTKTIGVDEILPEYDFSLAARNKYASRVQPGVHKSVNAARKVRAPQRPNGS